MNSGSSTIAFVVAAILAWFGFASRKPEAIRPAGVAVIEALGGSKDALKQYEEQQKKERESLDEFRTTAPYREARSIAIDPAYGKILGFCSLGEGRLAAVTGQADAYGAVVDTHDPATVGNRLVWLSADGREERDVEGHARASDRIGIIHKAPAIFHHEGGAAKILDVREGFEEHLRLGGEFSNIHIHGRSKTAAKGRRERGETGNSVHVLDSRENY